MNNNMNRRPKSKGPFAPPRYVRVLELNVLNLRVRLAREINMNERVYLLGLLSSNEARLAAFVN